MKHEWFVEGRFRIPIVWDWVCYIPQPRWLKRWYYRKSYDWWNHPSNHHWKYFGMGGPGDCDCFVEESPSSLWKWWMKKRMLLPGERDLWDGCYCPTEGREKQWTLENVYDNDKDKMERGLNWWKNHKKI
jgi:hypothetical protein